MATFTHHGSNNNKIEDIAYKTADWIRKNRQTFYSIAGIVGGIILFTVFFFTRYFVAKERVSDKLSMAQSLLYHNQADQGIKMLDEVITQFTDSPSAYIARLNKADYLISQNKFDEAKNIILNVIANGKPEAIIPLAYPYLGEIQEDIGDLKGAVKTYNEFLVKFPDHFLSAKVMESLARVDAVSGNTEQAKAAYKRLEVEFKGTAWEKRAAEQLRALGK